MFWQWIYVIGEKPEIIPNIVTHAHLIDCLKKYMVAFIHTYRTKVYACFQSPKHLAIA
jgi:hypothetical protein